MCNCLVCQDIAIFRGKLEKVPPEDREYWDGIYDRLLNLDFDLDFYHTIAEGSWPEGEKFLESWAEKYGFKLIPIDKD